MTQASQKIAVSQPPKRGGADVDAKVLSGFNSQISFYEAALLKAKLQASAKLSRAAELAKDDYEEEESALLAETEAQAEAQVEAEALLSGFADAEPPTVLLAASSPAASDPAKAGTPLFAADNPLSYVLPALLVGTAFGGGSSTVVAAAPTPPAPAPDDHCQIDFTFPNRPAGATVETLSVAALETEVQASASPMVLTEGQSLVVELGAISELSGFSGNDFLVTASGNVGDLYINVGNSANAAIAVDVTGGIGDISLRTGNDTKGSVGVIVSAAGDVGNVTVYADGYEAGLGPDDFNLNASGGDVGRVDVMFANPNGDGSAYVIATAAVSGVAMVGGNVGDVRLAVVGPESEGQLQVTADGGDLGNVEAIACGGSASGDMMVYAYAQLDGNGRAAGGNVGDVSVVAKGGLAQMEAYVYASGILSSGGQYLGGNIGNVYVMATGGDAEASAGFFAHGGGSIGNITIETSLGDESYEASANVSAVVHGAGGKVASIGDVTMAMDVHDGMDNSAYVNLDAYTGGNIGTITATATGGGSGMLDISAYAYANDSDEGGRIGAISLTNTSWAGDNSIKVYADTSIGDLTVIVGGGSADVRLDVNAGVNATVGNISVAFDSESYSYGFLSLGLATGASGAEISVTGGGSSSRFSILANDLYFNYLDGDGDADEEGEAKVAGNIDMAGFGGFSAIDLNTVEAGVIIDVGSGGSSVLGSLGADTITLGAGSDQISFNNYNYDSDLESNFFTPTDTDTITGFDAVEADETDAIDSFYINTWGGDDLIQLTANAVRLLTNNEAVTLVDLAGNQLLSTTEGLLEALNVGGEYALVDGQDGMKYTFATASATTATSFNLFRVEHDGGEFTNASLLAEVSMATGSTFADLSTSNFTNFIV
jgi:hypothetical protein